MANETYVTVRGRLTSDPEMRFTPSGAGVANFTVASNSRKFDKNTNEWVNKEAKFWRCNAWNQGKLTLAENIAEGLKKGDAVIVYAEIETRSYTTKEGENRTVDELRVESIGKDLVFSKPSPQSGTQSQPPQQNQQSQPPANDPWSAGGNNGGWDQGAAPF
ncbi:single-stranded DNA-binding protein [Glutamicibacter ardleyensis]|uniref:single-stranded DNA-binding protein n=1 Tax=Glutamicibacter ardleyensis TaxID=225894 RepID=UPI003FCF1014